MKVFLIVLKTFLIKIEVNKFMDNLFNSTEIMAVLDGLPKRFRSDVWQKYFYRGYKERFYRGF